MSVSGPEDCDSHINYDTSTLTATDYTFTDADVGVCIRIDRGHRYRGIRWLIRRIRYWRTPWMAYEDWDPGPVFTITGVSETGSVVYENVEGI